jgi:hypothetical protein
MVSVDLALEFILTQDLTNKIMSLIKHLQSIEDNDLKGLLDNPEIWSNIDIDYHPPRVERLWTPYKEGRLCLHIIHKCDEGGALYHPHPWPSSMKVLSGIYKMGVACEVGADDRPMWSKVNDPVSSDFIYKKGLKVKEVATIELHSGSYYEMPDKKGWHYVQPLTDVAYTLMYIGKPFETKSEGAVKADKDLKRFSKDRVKEILSEFKEICNG